jgi:hypothetical protein
MMKIQLRFFAVLLMGITVQAQVGINTASPNPSALLDLNSSNKGLLLPRVTLLSTSDIVTIPNPAKGLMVYATQDMGTGITAIQKDTLYKFDGVRWKALTTREKLLSTDMPRIVAVGRKTTEEGCVGLTNGFFNLSQRSNPAFISARGALTAPQDGYYMFSVRLTELMPASGQDLELGPYIHAANLATYSYKYRGNGNQAQIAAILGTVYLTQGQTTSDFQWFLGNNTCTSANRIQGQEVIWEYLGNPL